MNIKTNSNIIEEDYVSFETAIKYCLKKFDLDMTHKEKAKAYDKALKRAKEIKSNILSSHLSTESRKAVSEYIDTIIPELRESESEDERIRKWLYDYISNCPNNNFAFYGGVGKDAVLNYLEKRKEPKWSPSEGEMGVLYKLCYISNQITDEDDTELTRLYQDLKREYFNGHSFENMFLNEKQKEQKPTELPKSEDYGIDGLYAAVDILQKTLGEVDGYQTDAGILEHKCAISAVKELYEQQPSEWSDEDEKMLSDVIKLLKVKNEKFIPCDAEVSWLNELPNRFNLQPKQEWSEEDEYEMSRRCGQALFDHGYIKEYEWFKTYLLSKTELDEKDEKIRKGLLDIFKRSQFGHWGKMEIKDIVAFLERQENNIDKLRKISTKAEEDWLEIQKQWEKEDKYKSWMEDYFRQETIDGHDWKASIIEFKKEGKLSSLWNSMLMGRLGMYVRNWMREQHPEIDQDFPNYADFEDYSWKIFQDLVNEWEVTPTERNIEDVAAEYIEGVKSVHEEPDWNLMHTAVIYGYQLGTEKCKTK